MKLETKCVREGYNPKNGEPQVAPIVQSTTYYYDDPAYLADLFDLKQPGHIYSRLTNPTNAILETKIAALEGGTGAVACASGMSAILMSILNVCCSGDNVICSNAIYGGSYNLFSVTLPKYGINAKFVDPDASIEEIEALVDDNTKVIFAESISNPTMVVLDFDKFSSVAKKYQILFMVDSTLSTPILCRPKEFGANVVIHSTSKYIDGHAVALGGISVDCGNFVFENNKRYPLFNNPDESYHGLVYASLADKAFGTKMISQMTRDFGAIMSPQNAWLTNLGCETLALRMKQHISNVNIIAKYLKNNDMISWVKHPSLESDKYYDLAQKYMPNGVSGMISFGIKGGREAAAKFMANLNMISMVTHVADVRSCVLHPASTTHRQLSDEALKNANISSDLIRLSVGIEDACDIISDIEQALGKL